MIQTKKISTISTKVPPDSASKKYINIFTWHPASHPNGSKYRVFSPYFLKTDGQEKNYNEGGVLFENFWQGSKVWQRVYNLEVWAHKNLRGQPQHLWWSHVCDNGKLFEDHVVADEIQPDYYVWRQKVWDCPKPIRYPNGFSRTAQTLFSLEISKDGTEQRLNYLEARKEIYFKEYCRLVEKLPEYKTLLGMLQKGQDIVLCETDVPDNEIMDQEKLAALLINPSIKFGHGLCLAYSLLNHLNNK